VLAFRVSPAGNVPLTSVQVYGPTPPAADKVAEYGTPAVPLGSEVVETRSVAGVMVRETATVIVCAGLPESVAENVRDTVPVAVMIGVPLMVPLEVLSNSPCGSVPPMRDQEYGAVPPLACNVAL
jgi:hypothetical protein